MTESDAITVFMVCTVVFMVASWVRQELQAKMIKDLRARVSLLAEAMVGREKKK